MAQVTVKINGFAYTVGCEDGQEPHLQAMAEQVQNRVESIKGLGGQSGEARLLVLAALLMADELHDLTVEMRDMTTEMTSLRAAKPRNGAAPVANPQLAQRLGQLATRAEEIAAQLEHP